MLQSIVIMMILAAEPSGSVSTSAKPQPDRWILRHRPRNHDVELGVFAGALVPAPRLDLRGPDSRPGDFDRAAADVGLRIGYFPLRFFGFEAEAAFAPTRYEGASALVYGVRAQGVLQAGWWRIVPFATLGGGLIGVGSRGTVAGVDTDPAMHVGGGVKINATERLTLRVDVRDIVAGGGVGALSHSPEALLTVALRFGGAPKPKPPAPIVDEDGDGVADADDWCPKQAGPKDNRGCPRGDRDCDRVNDHDDRCPDDAGEAADGCAPPDGDGDGIIDNRDACPSAAGLAPEGCPDLDPDRDGIEGEADKCATEPETANEFEDDDGCPDELPPEVKKFSGVIAGIVFATNTANIQASSTATLDEAAKTLQQYQGLALEVVGHTDDRGARARNVELSLQRAEAVKTYLVGKGIAPERIRTRGAGPDEPRSANTTAKGRAENRRIEFKLVP